jgi:hypothetical protein
MKPHMYISYFHTWGIAQHVLQCSSKRVVCMPNLFQDRASFKKGAVYFCETVFATD